MSESIWVVEYYDSTLRQWEACRSTVYRYGMDATLEANSRTDTCGSGLKYRAVEYRRVPTVEETLDRQAGVLSALAESDKEPAE